MKTKLILPVFFLVVFSLSVFVSATDISNCNELQNIKNNLNEDYQLINDIDCSDTKEWNNGKGFEPIGICNPASDCLVGYGDEIDVFRGSLKGNGYIISDLYINRPSEDFIGLFGYIRLGGDIRGIGLTNLEIYGNDAVGGLVALNKGGAIKDSYSEGRVVGNDNVGGLIGLQTSGEILSSYSKSEVNGDSLVGGFIGANEGHGDVDSSYFKGVVNGVSYIGGFVGRNTGSIKNSYTVSKINVLGEKNIGGFVGYGYNFANPQDDTNFYDKEYSNIKESSNGIGKTSSEMKNRETFSKFDFINTWGLNPNDNEGYPFLRFEGFSSIAESEIGSKTNPIRISSCEELQDIKNNLAYYVLTEDIDCTVTKNWNNGKGFEPIGTKDKWFEGNLNGKGYTISNLYINRPSEDFIGLFGRVAGAQISNLFLTNVEVYGNNSVGGLIGASSYYRNGDQEGVVSECHVKGKIKGEGKYVGSLIGYNYDTLVSNCFSEGEVRGEDLVGGLIGDNQYSDVKDSSSKATVKSNILKNEKSRAGGLVGHNGPEGVISNSKSEGKVNGGFLISLLTKKLFSIIVLTILLLPLITTWKKISYSKKGASIGLIIGTTVYLPNLIKYFIFNERDILLTGFVTPNFRNYLNIFYGLFKINIVFLYILVSVIIIFCLAIIGVIIGRRIEKSKETKNYNFTN